MGYLVGIVGATGAVGKEICDGKWSVLLINPLRIFESSCNAGLTIKLSTYGTIHVKLFDVTNTKAQECDVVFLAVSGKFLLEHAKAILQGNNGTIVNDILVRRIPLILFIPKNLIPG